MIIDRGQLAAALPNYELMDQLGAGYFGLVLAGRHRHLERDVAIKVLAVADEGADGRFTAEARLLARMDHPHIVRVYDYVEHDGLRLIVMELLAGGSLSRRLAGMPPESACAVGIAVAEALSYAHAQGVLHRDIKPDNVLFDAAGQVKVTDFGIAKIFDGSAATASAVAGTPAYMAPEQITGGRLGPATDIYALGLVLYEMLAGTPPFDQKLPLLKRYEQQLSTTPPPLTGIPPVVADVVMHALIGDIRERPHSAQAFAAELAAAVDQAYGQNSISDPGPGVKFPPPGDTRAHLSRAPDTRSLASVRGVATVNSSDVPLRPRHLAGSPAGTIAPRKSIRTESADGAYRVVCAALNERPLAVTLTGGPDRDRPLLDQQVHVWDLAAGTVRRTIRESDKVRDIACASLRDRPVALTIRDLIDRHGNVTMWDLADGGRRDLWAAPSAQAVACTQVDQRPVAVVLSWPGHSYRHFGSMVPSRPDPASGEQGCLRVWDLHSAKLVPAGHPPGPVSGRPRFYHRFRGSRGAGAPAFLQDQDGPVSGLVCGQLDGRAVAVASMSQSIDDDDDYTFRSHYRRVTQVWDLPSGALRVELADAENIGSMAFTLLHGSPVLVAVSGETELRVWDLRTGALRNAWECGNPVPVRIACTELNGQPIVVAIGSESPVGNDFLIADDDSAAADTDVSVIGTWDLATGTRLGTWPEKGTYFADLACARLDGQPVAVTVGRDSRGGLLQVWDLR